jgi:hypothetical protein
MNQRLLSALLTGLLPPLLAAPTLAQDGPRSHSQSHVRIPSVVGDSDQAEQFLAQRLRDAQQFGGLQKLLDDRDLRRLLGDIQRNPDKYGLREEIDNLRKKGERLDLADPHLRQLIARALKQPGDVVIPGATIPHEKLEEWKDWLDRFGGNDPTPADTDGGPKPARAGADPGTEPPVNPPRPSTSPVHPPGKGATPGPPTNPPSSIPPSPEAQNHVNKGLLQFAEKLRDLDTPLKKSPAWQHFIRDLEQGVGNHAGDNSALADKARGLADRLPPLTNYLPLDRLKGDNGLAQWGKSLLPKPPSVNWGNAPKVPSTAGWHLPHVGGASLGGTDDWKDILWLLMLLGVAAFLLVALVWQRRRQARRAGASWRLGPWPVDPAAVRTRDELVRAFEYLSLLRLGPRARSRNHLEIADSLGLGAARHLAHAYEQARYAPPTDALSDADLADARRHLTFLAGAPSA